MSQHLAELKRSEVFIRNIRVSVSDRQKRELLITESNFTLFKPRTSTTKNLKSSFVKCCVEGFCPRVILPLFVIHFMRVPLIYKTFPSSL